LPGNNLPFETYSLSTIKEIPLNPKILEIPPWRKLKSERELCEAIFARTPMQAFDRNQISVQVSGLGFQNLGFADT